MITAARKIAVGTPEAASSSPTSVRAQMRRELIGVGLGGQAAEVDKPTDFGIAGRLGEGAGGVAFERSKSRAPSACIS